MSQETWKEAELLAHLKYLEDNTPPRPLDHHQEGEVPLTDEQAGCYLFAPLARAAWAAGKGYMLDHMWESYQTALVLWGMGGRVP